MDVDDPIGLDNYGGASGSAGIHAAAVPGISSIQAVTNEQNMKIKDTQFGGMIPALAFDKVEAVRWSEMTPRSDFSDFGSTPRDAVGVDAGPIRTAEAIAAEPPGTEGEQLPSTGIHDSYAQRIMAQFPALPPWDYADDKGSEACAKRADLQDAFVDYDS